MPNWIEVLREIQELQNLAASSIDVVRKKYLMELHKKTGRNVFAYYSGFLSKPDINLTEIIDEDKNGFMMTTSGVDKSKGLDLILHTPGGHIAATQSIVDYLHKMFNKDMRVIVPQIAMSAGSMMACSSKEILMTKHSNIGPIDPHLNGVPAYGVISEFKRAVKEIKKYPERLPLWQEIIGQYRPTFLSRCEHAIKWSNEFVQEQLENVMFEGMPRRKEKAKKIVKKLSSYTGNRTHNRHIHFEECKEIGLKVSLIEDDPKLQDLVLTVHHCYMHSLMNTRAYKIIENHTGNAIVRNVTQ